jgi:hypothetical protein
VRAWTAAAAVAVGAAAFLAYGGGFPNTDASWTLVWGRELLHLDAPSFAAGATPHPLPNLLGLVAAAVHPASETVLMVVGYLAIGALVMGAFALGRALFGVAAGVLAAVLVFTRDTLLFYGALAYLDVLFAALVVWAVALEAERPRRGVPVLAVLAVAGLVRPEAWLLAAAYWVYARPPGRAAVLLVVAAPLLWAAHDLILTGDPTFSFTTTTEATGRSGRPTGLEGAFVELPRDIARTARPDVCVATVLGLAVAWRAGRFGLLFGALVASTVATAIPVLAGTPMNDRYLMVTMALLCVAAAAPISLLRETGAWRAAGAVSLALLVAGAVVQAPRFVDRRDDVVDRASRRADAHDALRPEVPCLPVVLPNNRLIPVVASWLDLPISQVRDGRDGVPRGSYLWGTDAAMENLVVIEGRAGGAAPAPSAPVVRRAGGWTLTARCGR